MRFKSFMSSIPGFQVTYDEQMYERTLNFIMEMDPDVLSMEQLEEISSILSDIEIQGEDSMEEEKLANASSTGKKQKTREYYIKNRSRVKAARDKLNKSIEGKGRKAKKDTMEKGNKSPTGRDKVKYRKEVKRRSFI